LTVGHSELQFFYQEGSSWLFPEAFDEYLAPIPEAERHDLVLAYHAQLNSVDDETRLRAAKAWSWWEVPPRRLFVDDAKLADAENDAFAK
jgi:proline iminopeptidase